LAEELGKPTINARFGSTVKFLAPDPGLDSTAGPETGYQAHSPLENLVAAGDSYRSPKLSEACGRRDGVGARMRRETDQGYCSRGARAARYGAIRRASSRRLCGSSASVTYCRLDQSL